jgi:hypothetical protein
MPDGQFIAELVRALPYSTIPTGEDAREVLAFVAKALEARNSELCDCDDPDGEPPTNNGERIDHHCECRAVLTSAQLLGGQRFTVHADQCSRELHEELDRIHAEYADEAEREQ